MTDYRILQVLGSVSSVHSRLFLFFIMVARSSDSESEATIKFYGELFIYLFYFFSRHTFSDVGKPTSPKLSHTTWLSIQQNLRYSDFFKVPHKTYGGRKTQNLHHFSCQVADITAGV